MKNEELRTLLTSYHLQVFSSGRKLFQALEEFHYGRNLIAPAFVIKRFTLIDTVADRRLEQFLYLFTELQKKATAVLPSLYMERGNFVARVGSFIDSCFLIHWAEYQSNSINVKQHVGFTLNQGIPRKLFLSEGNGAERSFVSQRIDSG